MRDERSSVDINNSQSIHTLGDAAAFLFTESSGSISGTNSLHPKISNVIAELQGFSLQTLFHHWWEWSRASTKALLGSEAADSIPVHNAAGLFRSFILRRCRRRHLSVLQVHFSSGLGHQRLTAVLNLPLVPRHQRGIDTTVSRCDHHQDAHRATNHTCNYLRALRPADAGRPVALTNAFLIAADPARRAGGPAAITWHSVFGLTLRALAEHLSWDRADVPALQIPRVTALHGIYLPIYKTNGVGKSGERAQGKDEVGGKRRAERREGWETCG